MLTMADSKFDYVQGKLDDGKGQVNSTATNNNNNTKVTIG